MFAWYTAEHLYKSTFIKRLYKRFNSISSLYIFNSSIIIDLKLKCIYSPCHLNITSKQGFGVIPLEATCFSVSFFSFLRMSSDGYNDK